MNKKEVLSYLHMVFDAEVSIFQQKQILKKLSCERDHARVGRYESEEMIKTRWKFFPSFEDTWFNVFSSLGVIWFVFATFAIIFQWSFISDVYDKIKEIGIKWYYAYMVVAILLPIGVTVLEGIIELIYYLRKYKGYVLRTKRENEIKKQNNDRILELQNNKKNEITRKIEGAKIYYYRTVETLEKLYSANVIYEKYRNIVAVGMLCEYFESGRCSTLEGHEGAYNIYENEIRQNIIISKLDIIITELEKIEQNQYMIHQAIQNSNRKIEEISSEILSSHKSIQQNQKIIEYYNSITANNTEFLKWERIFNIM